MSAEAQQAQTASLHRADGQASMRKRLARGGSISFLINSAGMGLSMLMQVALARMLGAAGYGLFAFVTTITTFVVFPAKLGFDTTIVRMAAAYRAKGEWELLTGLLRRGNQFGMALSSAAAVIGITVVLVQSGGEMSERTVTYAAGFATVPLLTLATLRQSALQALKDVLFAQMPEKIIRPILTIGLLAAAASLGWKADAGTAMLAFAVSVILSYAIGAVVLRKRLLPHTSGLAPRYDTKGWLRISTSLMINAGMYLVLGQLNVLMMGVMLGETSTGIFSAAVRLASLVSFMLTAINMTASPLVSETYARGDMKGLQRVCETSGRAGFLFAAAVFAGLAIGGRWVLGLFGPAFHDAYVPLLILAAGQLFSSFCGQNGTVATMTGRTSSLTKVLIAAAIVNALLNAALIPTMGMVGGAIAASLSVAMWNTAMVVIVKRQLGIQTMAWPMRSGKR